jgi:hypothetical protein
MADAMKGHCHSSAFKVGLTFTVKDLHATTRPRMSAASL